MRQSSTDLVASHMSAAAVHGLPLWEKRLARVSLTRNRVGGGQSRRYATIHGLPLAGEDVEVVNGVLVTTVARTILDLACALPRALAVPIGDAALRRKLSEDELAGLLDRAPRRKGIGQARRTIAFLDARSESPGESCSRVVVADLGLPRPELQSRILGPQGELIARCDFDWPAFRTVGEFDGKIKYGRALEPGRPVEDVLFDEKLREDRVRDTGLQMVRWIWADLHEPVRLQDRLERAFARGRR